MENNSLKYIDYFGEMTTKNRDDMYTILDIAAKEIYRQLNIKCDTAEMLGTIFHCTITSLVDRLFEKSVSGYQKYCMFVANRFEIGYDNAINRTDAENIGCVSIYINHLYKDNVTKEKTFEDKSIELCTQWNTENVAQDINIIRGAVAHAYSEIVKQDIAIESQMIVLPITCIIYDTIIDYIKVKRLDSGEFDEYIDVMNLFKVFAQENTPSDLIMFEPALKFKRQLKSDALHSSVYEE